jgi:uncharacterized membrane protein YphA (DoxX/SURF4 family)
MSNQPKPSMALNITLWVAQFLLASSLVWAGFMKLFQPEKVAAMWPWAGQVSDALVKFTGIVDLLGAIGLILPAMLRIKPKLTPIAALGVVALMITASIFHIVRGEASSIGANIVFGIIATFIAWGRFTKAPITEK